MEVVGSIHNSNNGFGSEQQYLQYSLTNANSTEHSGATPLDPRASSKSNSVGNRSYRVDDLINRNLPDSPIRKRLVEGQGKGILGCCGLGDSALSNDADTWSLCSPSQKDFHLRVAGPSMGGKSSFVRFLHHGQFVETTPTNVMEVSKIYWKGTPFVMWDSRKFDEEDLKPGVAITPNLSNKADKLVAARKSMDALVYLIDASDPGRLKIARRDFVRLLKSYRRVPVVLILGTKKDKGNVVDQIEIKSQLKCLENAYNKECTVILISTVTGEGIDEAMEWLMTNISTKESLISRIIKFISCQGFVERWRINLDMCSTCRYSRLS